MSNSNYYCKQSLLLMIMLLAFSLSTNAKKKTKPIFKYQLEVTSTPSEKGKLITFDAYGSEYSGYWIRNFEVKNGTDERIYIEWENARLDGSRVVFGDDSRISMRNPKADEAVSSHETSISREITGEKKIDDEYQIELYNVRDLKKKNLGLKDRTYIIRPIRYMDGTVEEFKLEFTAWFELPPTTE